MSYENGRAGDKAQPESRSARRGRFTASSSARTRATSSPCVSFAYRAAVALEWLPTFKWGTVKRRVSEPPQAAHVDDGDSSMLWRSSTRAPHASQE